MTTLGRTEIEDLALNGYVAQSLVGTSGGAVVKTDKTGTATGAFTGPAGTYDLTVGYFNENDGVSKWSLKVDGVVVKSWSGIGGDNANEEITARVALTEGATVSLTGTKDIGEFARLDYLDIAEASPAPVRILPLGDSITFGSRISGLDANPTGYRAPLEDMLIAAGYDNFDFVGTYFSGASELADGDHDGLPGRRASGNATALVNTIDDIIAAQDPTVVLLMIGTNDVLNEKATAVDTLDDDIRAIVGAIHADDPDTMVFVSTLPAIDPDYPTRPGKSYAIGAPEQVAPANDAIRTAVGSLSGNVRLVDLDDHPEIGLFDSLHPSPEGYDVIADAWFDALVRESGTLFA